MKKEYLLGGRICTSHGVAGGLKLEHYCDSEKVLAKQKRIFFKNRDGSFSEKRVKNASVFGKFVLMTIEGIDTREDAIALRGKEIYLHRDDIPLTGGAMLIADMIGLRVFHAESGEPLGEISDVSDVAGRRIYTIRYEGVDVMLPDVAEFIKEISEEGMRVLPIPGFFDKADEV
ncbi:MAG: 16S rRNA processing protein RimM [Clostridia bacterium]|nr:16S rRNA processing protein RimM [Clostridia bacterium]MBO5316637.1 16S rRNA processing protein RimM [Clostridia bacterium]